MEFIIGLFTSPEFGNWVAAITMVVTASNAITVLTPTNVDNQVLDVVLRILNILSGNFGKNKNADDISPEPDR